QINESQFYFYSLNKEKLHNIELIFGIKVKDSKNKLSELSQLVSIKPGIPPSPPQNVNFSVYEDKILLKWDPPEKNDNSIIDGYRVYRWNEEKKIPMLLNSLPIKETSFEDRNFIYDKKYFYVIRSITYPPVFYIPLPYPFLFFNTYFHKKEELFNSIIESENSNIIEIIPKDTFPPKAPQGLVAIPGKKVITLMWDPNIERDLEGYRVWRKTEFEKEFSLLTLKPILNNSYRDEMLEENLTYYYYVTAIDKKKNESEKSQIIKIKFQKVEEGNENLSLSLSGKKILWYIEGGKSLSYRRFHIQKF
ncbi:fibronectin type III domain-containing protein, partial [Candidatus Aminicenantes bacterium AH-873-B07]|nr:fibronectin type III domain-containing protein [Candidatus Aminicenantes bacterium AH-873-B07]